MEYGEQLHIKGYTYQHGYHNPQDYDQNWLSYLTRL